MCDWLIKHCGLGDGEGRRNEQIERGTETAGQRRRELEIERGVEMEKESMNRTCFQWGTPEIRKLVRALAGTVSASPPAAQARSHAGTKRIRA